MPNNLLLVLRDKKELDVLSKHLQLNYNVFTAGEPATMLQKLRTVSTQLIICSIDLPVLSGWEVCNRLKSTLHYAHIPVILLTDNDTIANRIKNLESGADAFVNRPFPPKYLEAQITNLLINRKKVLEYVPVSQSRISTAANDRSDGEFIKKLNDHICKNVHNSSLNVNGLARFMNMSRPTFYRKIKKITDLSPHDLINLARLQRAARLLESAEYKINEVARMTGFLSQSSFGKAFIKQFKITPTEYQRMRRNAHN